MAKEKGVYHFALGKEGQDRHDLINRLNNPSSCKFLLKKGLQPGMTVLELGCGTGTMAIWLAQQVTSSGRVIAIDNSEKQLEIAKAAAEKAGVNIEFHQMPVNDVGNLGLNGTIDFVFSRFLFMQLTHPQEALNIVKNVLKLNTDVIVSQELISKLAFSSSDSPALPQLVNLAAKLNKHLNKDNNLGLKLLKLYKDAGLKFSDSDYKFKNTLLKTKEEKLLYYKSLAEATPTIFKNNLATEEEVNELKEGLMDLANTEDIIVGGMSNIIIAGTLMGEQHTPTTDLE
ncbi:class I SAM-dependent methyltransferase [Rickettsia endosymbiont of Lasioglossum villosulum]|uniref:class I SAM-dependent methyltransferase n=1 Tax=Rickettsia endosymbiont of Lasioglossum villosulum TaxID=3066269 RepID=UPI003132E5A4